MANSLVRHDCRVIDVHHDECWSFATDGFVWLLRRAQEADAITQRLDERANERRPDSIGGKKEDDVPWVTRHKCRGAQSVNHAATLARNFLFPFALESLTPP
jgi:hypothetical protein